MLVQTAFVALLLGPSLAAVSYYLFLVAARCRGLCDERPASAAPQASILVLIPAHNEMEGIAATIRSCQAVDYPRELLRIVVLADNCDDATAARARRMGVECLERHAPEQRGKGAALAWAFEQLASDPADAVLVLDADCQLEADCLRVAASFLEAGDRVLQLNHAVTNPDVSAISYAASVGRTLEYDLFFAPKSRLGLSVLLVGTGMVFHRDVLRQHRWTSDSCAEDTEQTYKLAQQGQRVRFVSNAHVRFTCVESPAELRVQRRRWASGNWHLGRQHALRMIVQGIRLRNLLLVDLGWTLCLQSRPLVLAHLATTLLAGWLLTWYLPGRAATVLFGLVAGLVPLYAIYLAIGIVWLGMTRSRARLLLGAPAVVAEMARISLAAIVRPAATTWTRTPRR
jgi:cellulose synthase/poly-beta-1,6-N-acetylglucosamine synthase-like glycosyltransferase